MLESGPKFENGNSEMFPNTYIEKEVASLLQNIKEIQEIKRLRIKGEGGELSLTGSFLAKVKVGGFIPVKINIDIDAQVENSGDSIQIKDGYRITADKGQDQVRAEIEPHLSKLPIEIKNFIEKEQGKTVEKIWIEDGKLRVQYPQTPKEEDSPEELEKKFGGPAVDIENLTDELFGTSAEKGVSEDPKAEEVPVVDKPRKSARERKEELAKKIALDETAEDISFEEVDEKETSADSVESNKTPDKSLTILEISAAAKRYISKWFETGIIYADTNDTGDIVLTTSFKDSSTEKNESLTITLKNTEDRKTLETVAETKGLANVHVDTVGQGIQEILEQEKGKKVEQIWIEDGKIHAIYSEEDIETNEFVVETPVPTGTKVEKLNAFKPLEGELLRIENAYNGTAHMTFKSLLDALPERKAAYAPFIKKGIEYETSEGTEIKLDPEDDRDEAQMMNIANGLVEEMNAKIEEEQAAIEKEKTTSELPREFDGNFVEDTIIEMPKEGRTFDIGPLSHSIIGNTMTVNFWIRNNKDIKDLEIPVTVEITNSPSNEVLQVHVSGDPKAEHVLSRIGLAIEKRIEETAGKAVDKMWLQDGKIHVTYNGDALEPIKEIEERFKRMPSPELPREFDVEFISNGVREIFEKNEKVVLKEITPRVEDSQISFDLVFEEDMIIEDGIKTRKGVLTIKDGDVKDDQDRSYSLSTTLTIEDGKTSRIAMDFITLDSHLQSKIKELLGETVYRISIKNGKLQASYMEDILKKASPEITDTEETVPKEDTLSTPPETIKINPESILSPNAQTRIAEQMKLLNKKFAEKKKPARKKVKK